MSEIVYTSKQLSEQHACKVQCFLTNRLHFQSLKNFQAHCFQNQPFWQLVGERCVTTRKTAAKETRQLAASDVHVEYIIQVGNRWTGLSVTQNDKTILSRKRQNIYFCKGLKTSLGINKVQGSTSLPGVNSAIASVLLWISWLQSQWEKQALFWRNCKKIPRSITKKNQNKKKVISSLLSMIGCVCLVCGRMCC